MSQSILHDILGRAGLSPRTKEKYRLVIDRWLAFAGESPKGWTRIKAQEFYDHLLENEGVKIQSANVYLASLRYVSQWYATRMQNPQLDFALVQKQRGKKKREDRSQRMLTDGEITALVESCATGKRLAPVDLRDLAIIVVGLETGMRRMSIQGIEFFGFTDKLGYPSVRVPIKGEGGEQVYHVPLSGTAQLALDTWKTWLLSHSQRSGPLFRRVNGSTIGATPLSLTAIYDVISSHGDAAGLDHIHPHVLRHTFITSRTLAGYSEIEIATMTGHTIPGITASRHYIDERAIAEKIRNSTPAWFAQLVAGLLQKGTR